VSIWINCKHLTLPLPFDDLFIFDFFTNHWEEELFVGAFPHARLGSSLVSIPTKPPTKPPAATPKETKVKETKENPTESKEPTFERGGYILLFGGAGPVVY